jgi:hypothetical protein
MIAKPPAPAGAVKGLSAAALDGDRRGLATPYLQKYAFLQMQRTPSL